MDRVEGGCLCGAVRITAEGAPDRVGLCHCLDCRKCPRCGGSVFSVRDGEVEVHLGALDAPNVFEPTYELWCVRREKWLPEVPGLARFERDEE
ncbi:GFA family protein [Roseovarius sp. B08]|uniref:GFA family protein n=1 Tax=Roseovarius sp. B08 TaxID=3449223 RepID=UPI003EDBAF53